MIVRPPSSWFSLIVCISHLTSHIFDCNTSRLTVKQREEQNIIRNIITLPHGCMRLFQCCRAVLLCLPPKKHRPGFWSRLRKAPPPVERVGRTASPPWRECSLAPDPAAGREAGESWYPRRAISGTRRRSPRRRSRPPPATVTVTGCGPAGTAGR